MAVEWLGMTMDQFQGVSTTPNAIKDALDLAGVDTLEGFLSLTFAQIDGMRYTRPRSTTPGGHVVYDLSLADKQLLKVAYCCYHHLSRKNHGPIPVTKIVREEFQEFRVHSFDPHQEPKPWHESINKEKSNWEKSVVKANKSDFKPLKNEANYEKWKERFLLQAKNSKMYTTLILDRPLLPSETELDASKCEWMMLCLWDCMQTSNSKEILQRYRRTNDTRGFFKELDEFVTKFDLCQEQEDQSSHLPDHHQIGQAQLERNPGTISQLLQHQGLRMRRTQGISC